MKIVICGSGPGAHALASKIHQTGKYTQVILLELKKDSIDRQMKIQWPDGQVTTLNGCSIMSDPSLAIPNATTILLCNPSNSYPLLLKEIAKYVTSATKLIAGIPGVCAFDWMVREAFAGKEKSFTIAATESLPFIAKREADNLIKVHAYKQILHLASYSFDKSEGDKKAELEALLEIPLRKLDLFLSLTLLNPGAKVHPLLFLESLKHVDKVAERNIFELGNEGAARLEKVEQEVSLIAHSLAQESGLTIYPVLSLKQWFTDCYQSLLGDNTSVQSCLSTHPVYASLKENFLEGIQSTASDSSKRKKSRYLTEEIPYGLLCLKGLAELVNLETPTIDGVIEECQVHLDKKYIESGKLIQNNLEDTASPQRFGMTVLSKLLRQYGSHSTNKRSEVKEFKDNGVVFFGKLLDSQKSSKIQQVISQRIENVSAVDTEKLLLNLHWTDPRIAQFCSYPEFVSTACDLLQVNRVKVFSSLIVFKKPNEKMPVPWHQDPAYQWPLDPLDCASLWFALDDITQMNGAMEMVVGGHKAGIFPMIQTPVLQNGEYHFSPQLAQSIAESSLEDYRRVHCDMQRYECSFHHSMMPHSSPLNLTQDRRCAFIIRYCRGDAKIKTYPGMPRENFFREYKLFDPHLNLTNLQHLRESA